MSAMFDFHRAVGRVATYYGTDAVAVYEDDDGWLKHRIGQAVRKLGEAGFLKLLRAGKFLLRGPRSASRVRDEDGNPVIKPPARFEESETNSERRKEPTRRPFMARRTFGSVFKRKGRAGWWIQFHHRGQRYLRYGGSTKGQGEKKLGRIDHLLRGDGKSIREVLAEVFPDSDGYDQPTKLTFETANEHYLVHARHNKKRSTLESDRQRLAIIRKTSSWRSRLVSHIETEEIQRWADKRREGGTSGATINRDLCLLSAFFGWAATRGHCYRNPVKRVQRFKENPARDVCLTLEEANRLIAVADPDVRPAIVFAIGTGMRRGEQLTLCWRDVDMETKVIRIRPENDKVHDGREVPMSAPVLEAIKEFRSRLKVKQIDGLDPVCVRKDGQKVRQEWLRGRFLAARKAANLPQDKQGLRWHDLRRVAGTLMLDSGSQLPHVSRVLGHRSVTTTMRYLKTGEDQKRSTVDALGARLHVPKELTVAS